MTPPIQKAPSRTEPTRASHIRTPPTQPTHIQAADAIADYYEQTDTAYRNWGNAGAYELHYGYHEAEESPTSVAASAEAHGRALRRMNLALADTAPVRAGDRVLDAGCGVGGSALWLTEHRQCRVHGISLSPSQILKARQFASTLSRWPQRLEFSVRDFTDTGFADQSFDVVWALESWAHTDHAREFLDEAYRVLRPQGRLVIADYFQTREPTSEIERYSMERWLKGWAIPGISSLEGALRGFSDAGFGLVHNIDLTERIRPSAEEIYRRGHDGYPADILQKGKNVLQIQHVEACLFQKICLDQGLWRYRVLSAEKGRP